MTKSKDSALKSWIEVPKESDFPIQNIPFGVIKDKNGSITCASRIGLFAINLSALAELGYLENLGIKDLSVFRQPYLNDFIALGRPVWSSLRHRLIELFEENNTELSNREDDKAKVLIPVKDVEMLLPVKVGDYTDFYSSIEHATNVGKMFRDPENALLPNWRHLPVGYHGRSSSIVVSGTNIHRPNGQMKPQNSDNPVFGPSKLLDFELETAFITGVSTKLGETIPVDKAEDYIFGMVLFNDLSARDIQSWEYVPLGPFLGKNFGSVVSPWIVTLEALEPFRVKGPNQSPPVLPYLNNSGKRSYDIKLEVYIQPENGSENKVCSTNFNYLYWNMSQQLAHHTVNGCNINVGDMYGSGTISGPSPESLGSMLELSWKGTKSITLNDGSERKFIHDNDSIIMRGWAEKEEHQSRLW